MASSSAEPKPVVGIVSIGDMGMGVAKLLLAHEYKVLTVSAGRSQSTIDRIRAAKIEDLPSDEALLANADIILSIVPPRDALATAKRIADAVKPAAALRRSTKGPGMTTVIYIDLNAISPRTVAKVDGLFNHVVAAAKTTQTPSLARRFTRSLSIAGAESQDSQNPPPPPISIKVLDGGIIGGPPSQDKSKTNQKDKENSKSTDGDATGNNSPKSSTTPGWTLPSIPLSGPHESLLQPSFLATLNMHFISPQLGTASALKSCFASLTKGFTALSILSYTTASTCGVLPHLQSHLDQYAPGLRERAEKSLVGMPPKAYRWVDEMREIGTTFKSSGGLTVGRDVYEGIAEVYRVVAEDTVLGAEKTGKRKRGLTAEDVAGAVEEGLNKKSGRGAGKDEKLELAWRGSWGL